MLCADPCVCEGTQKSVCVYVFACVGVCVCVLKVGTKCHHNVVGWSLCVSVCEGTQERESVCVRMHVCVCVCVCVCMCVCMCECSCVII
jgi:hypothetical protein